MIIKHKHCYGSKYSANINVLFPFTVISYLFYRIQPRLQPDFSSKIRLRPAPVKLEEVKSGASLTNTMEMYDYLLQHGAHVDITSARCHGGSLWETTTITSSILLPFSR